MNIRKTLFVSLFLTGLMMITSCGYEPIFYGIMHDVAPEKATVSGNIISIARCQVNGEEYLFLNGDGALMYKKLSSNTHGEWNTYSRLPFSLHHYNYFPDSTEGEGHIGHQILEVISDKDNIYMLTATVRIDNQYGIDLPEQFYLWSHPLNNLFTDTSAGWKNITEGAEKDLFISKYDTENGEFNTSFYLFSTNTPKPEHRKAYLRVTKTTDDGNTIDEYYTLNGQTNCPPLKDESIGTTNYVTTLEGNTRVNSAFYIGNTLFFSDSLSVTTNETANNAATFACMAGVNSSYNATKTLYLYEGTELQQILNSSSTISSLALTADSLIIGNGNYNSSYTSNGGIERVLLDTDGKPENKTSEFTNNAKYQFTSAYILMTLLCADPTKTEAEACLYATISYRGTSSSTSASPKDVGLWSYYPSRGNWNRE